MYLYYVKFSIKRTYLVKFVSYYTSYLSEDVYLFNMQQDVDNVVDTLSKNT